MTSSKALQLHQQHAGKLRITSKIPLKHTNNLQYLYTPGVADAVKAILHRPEDVYALTIKQNTIAVISDGSAVLGLGNVGPQAALPVMEGKCAIFQEFAGINAFPICLDSHDPDEIIQTVKLISPVFGGINLEDIAAPQCFYIEEKLQQLSIPVIHDDQHGTAIVILAGLINAAKHVHKTLQSCRIVINGAGAAGAAVAKLLSAYGCKHLTILDSKGIIYRERILSKTPTTFVSSSGKKVDYDFSGYKKELQQHTDVTDEGDLETATRGADILIGVSKKGLFTGSVIQQMASDSIVFALANPDPEMIPEDAHALGVAVIATGRSDFPNQINNALVYPGLFKALLKKRIVKVSEKIKIQTAEAIAALIKNVDEQNIIPSIHNDRLVDSIVRAVSAD